MPRSNHSRDPSTKSGDGGVSLNQLVLFDHLDQTHTTSSTHEQSATALDTSDQDQHEPSQQDQPTGATEDAPVQQVCGHRFQPASALDPAPRPGCSSCTLTQLEQVNLPEANRQLRGLEAELTTAESALRTAQAEVLRLTRRRDDERETCQILEAARENLAAKVDQLRIDQDRWNTEHSVHPDQIRNFFDEEEAAYGADHDSAPADDDCYSDEVQAMALSLGITPREYRDNIAFYDPIAGLDADAQNDLYQMSGGLANDDNERTFDPPEEDDFIRDIDTNRVPSQWELDEKADLELALALSRKDL